jgi:hypothetical protein
MLKFREYIKESVGAGSLSVFDIDDTLFSTTTQVLVKKAGKVVEKLTPAEFNVYKLKDGEEFDFAQFRSAKVFADTARPIETVFKTAKKLISKFSMNPDKRIIIVTARADLDDKHLFLDTFKKYGFDTRKVHIYRAGNIKAPGAEAKKQIVRDQMNAGKYQYARMFDDAKANLDKFMELKQEFPNVHFEAFLIHEDGRITRYNG